MKQLLFFFIVHDEIMGQIRCIRETLINNHKFSYGNLSYFSDFKMLFYLILQINLYQIFMLAILKLDILFMPLSMFS